MNDRTELIASFEGRVMGGVLHNGGYIHVPQEEAEQILALLKEQPEAEAVAPTISEGAEGEEVICCGSCGTSLYHLFPWIKINKAREFVQYCRHCGREVKWE